MMITNNNLDVYIADDHEIVAKAIANLLLSIKTIKTVRTFANGKELYSACLNKIPNLIILDMEMPIWNGMMTLKKLTEITSTPIIMLTMNDEKTLIEECIKSGAKGYLHKNCTIEELQNKVENLKIEKEPTNELLEAIEEVKNGKVETFKDFETYKKAMEL